jgi:hypothetical protein
MIAVATAARLAELPRATQQGAVLAGKHGIVSALRAARPGHKWPASELVARLLDAAWQLERQVAESYGTLIQMAASDDYDDRLLKVHFEQMSQLVAALTKLLESEPRDLPQRGSVTAARPKMPRAMPRTPPVETDRAALGPETRETADSEPRRPSLALAGA